MIRRFRGLLVHHWRHSTLGAKAAFISAAAASLLIVGGYAHAGEVPSAETTRQTVACLKLDDLQHLQALAVGSNLIAAAAAMQYAIEHGCTSLNSNTFVKVDKTVESKYVCIRPRGVDVCLWAPAESIQTVEAD
jgi:hypothetical protein